MENKSLYIHIPFCNNICFYCDFNKVFYNEKLSSSYLNFLINQINQDDNKYKTIYIGGGSPSSLKCDQLEDLLSNLKKHLDNDYEFTIEVNPKDIDDKKIKVLVDNKINRVSIGVQSFNNDILKSINRDHTKNDVINLIEKLRLNGINNISCDLMFGIQGQTDEILQQDLKLLVDLKIPHISPYALLIEPNTYFDIIRYKALDDDIEADQYDLISSYLKSFGYSRYEVSNFSLPGYESKHNLVYWNGKEYKGLGAGASGYENGIRYTYTRSISKYMSELKILDQEEIDEKEKEYEYIILHLRLASGINLKDFYDQFNFRFEEKYKKTISKLIKNRLCTMSETNFVVNEDKYFILNTILSYF